MSARKKLIITSIIAGCLLPAIAISATGLTQNTTVRDTLAQQLGWVESSNYFCGGYYLEEPFPYPDNTRNGDSVAITGKQGTISMHRKSTLEGGVTLSRHGQEITANKADLFRDPDTFKLTTAEMEGNVTLREPNTMIVAKQGRYDFQTDTKSLINITYRTTLNGNRQLAGPKIPEQEMEKERRIKTMTAWGKAYELAQAQSKVYYMSRASFSTCPPVNPAWRLKGSHIELNKNTGRGYATNARILVKNIPVFYLPYISFSIDNQRKSGFLWPTAGTKNIWGPYIQAPYYWNMAPNYDMTITPGILTKRGFLITDNFRYLTERGSGNFYLSVIPHDRYFSNFQTSAKSNPAYTTNIMTDIQPASVTQAELNRLINSSDARKGFLWRDNSRFNEHWSTHVDFNYAGDDYFMQDFGKLNEITQNQLLQEADVYYKQQNWNFTGTLQSYQTLHPINSAPALNQYRRFPQLLLNADYPDQKFGLEYFFNSEVAHFEILKTPGTYINLPVGNRLHLQPGVNLPIYTPNFFFNPRAQLAMTDYNLYQITDTNTPKSKTRVLPILDIASGLYFNRDAQIFKHPYQQTLEPQVYYTFIPYRNQSSIPVFDTTVNTLTYDQIFNYNRFTGIDRIGDANQLGVGVTTRFIDQQTGYEKMRLGVGDVLYFDNRRVTLCNDQNVCNDYPESPSNSRPLSPISGTLKYNVTSSWTFGTDVIWNSISKQLDNTTIGFHYQPDDQHIFNLGYSYVFNEDYQSGAITPKSFDNLKITDISFAWPVTHTVSAVGRWSQDWNANHFQNQLYGLQYDSCCWAIRLIGGRIFSGLNSTSGAPEYNNEAYVQIALKGLGDIGAGSSGLLNSVTGYNTQLG